MKKSHWAIGLAGEILYAKAFDDHADAVFYKEAVLKNSDCKRIAVTNWKVSLEDMLNKLSWPFTQLKVLRGQP